MATSSAASNATAEGAAHAAPPSHPNDHDISSIKQAHVEPAVIIADDPNPTSSGAESSPRTAREGIESAAPLKHRNGSAQLHLTALTGSPTTSSPNTPTASSSRAKVDLPTSIVPVFWQHSRHVSRASVASLTSVGITLTDNTADGQDAGQENDESPTLSGLQSPLWARQVDIDDYVKIEGDVPGVGGYIVWLVRVQTLDGGGSIVLRKRYSEFEALRAQLAATFPRAGEALPALPPKSVFYKFRPSFLEKRRVGLAYFLK